MVAGSGTGSPPPVTYVSLASLGSPCTLRPILSASRVVNWSPEKAIVRVSTQGISTSASTMTVRVGEPDETFSAVHDATFIKLSAGAVDAQNTNTLTVNLKTGELLAWELIVTGTIGTSHSTTVHLIGYYV